jgi:hypothetical protein
VKWYLDNKPWWEHIISGEYQNYYQKMYGDRIMKILVTGVGGQLGYDVMKVLQGNAY